MEPFNRIGDFLQRVQPYLWALFLALGAAGLVLGAIIALTQSLPLASLLLIGIGITFVSSPFGYLLVAWIRRAVRKYAPPEETGALPPGVVSGGPTMTPLAFQLINLYDDQQRQLTNYLRMNLAGVDCSHVTAAGPCVILKMELRNYTTSRVQLVRVIDSQGTGEAHELPGLPQMLTQFALANRCTETAFDIKLPIHGTILPDWLIAESSQPCPRELRWAIRGVWFVLVDGEERQAWGLADEFDGAFVPNAPRAAAN